MCHHTTSNDSLQRRVVDQRQADVTGWSGGAPDRTDAEREIFHRAIYIYFGDQMFNTPSLTNYLHMSMSTYP
jgi:hypothetical protein